MSITKKEALMILSRCAKIYDEQLRNKNLLFLLIDRQQTVHTLETVFMSRNFKHLTGLTSPLGANRFFEKILARQLGLNEFDLKDDGTTELKLKILPTLMSKNLSANMAGDFAGKTAKLYTEKIVGRLNGSMGFVFDEITKRYVPNTVLHEDMRDMVSPLYRIVATYRKNIKDIQYSEVVYAAKKVDFNSLIFPAEIAYLQRLI